MHHMLIDSQLMLNSLIITVIDNDTHTQTETRSNDALNRKFEKRAVCECGSILRYEWDIQIMHSSSFAVVN